MIKGKVSQTIEDIKSSKGSTTNITTLQPQSYPTIIIKGGGGGGGDQQQQQGGIEFDSDQETKTSLSEDLSVEQDRRSSGGSTKQKRSNNIEDSDSELENEILLEGDFEHSRFRRGFAHLKSKVKAKHSAHQAQKATLTTASATSSHSAAAAAAGVKKDTSPCRSTGSSSSSASMRGNFLRRRRNKGIETAELASPTNMASSLAATVAATGEMAAVVPVVVSGKPAKKSKHVTVGKKDIEIESGVEMFETMIPPTATALASHDNAPNPVSLKRDELDLPLQTDTENAPDYTEYTLKSIKLLYECGSHKHTTSNEIPLSSDKAVSKLKGGHPIRDYWHLFFKQANYMPLLSILGVIVIFIVPLNNFIRGVLSCLFGISIVEGLWNFTQRYIENLMIRIKPENSMFSIPDYSKMTICQVPAVMEHQNVKSYEGWMNTINSYDPNIFSLNMTKSVYVELDGSILNIYFTKAHIPKRVLWNEVPINHKAVQFTKHRRYDLLGCRIELLPKGLARKRHFNLKYPIQLIIKKSKVLLKTEEQLSVQQTKLSSLRHRNKKEKTDEHELAGKNNKSSEAESQTQDAGGEMDFGAIIMNADLQKLQDDVNPDEHLNTITVPCGDEVRILLFARNCREKEDWFRRFVAASSGNIHDQDLLLGNLKLIDKRDLEAATETAELITSPKPKENVSTSGKSPVGEVQRESFLSIESEETPAQQQLSPALPEKENLEQHDEPKVFMPDDSESIEGLLMLAGVARNDPNYVKFMAVYQKACKQSKIPVYKGELPFSAHDNKGKKRNIRNENELWKGINQSLFLGPSGSVVWANALAGRLLYSMLQNEKFMDKLQIKLQKKLNSIKLPSFMEDVVIKNIDPGDMPPLIHRVSQPLLDERGIWLDMDVTYEGHCHITITTKLNLLRLKRGFTDVIPNAGVASSMKDEHSTSNKAPCFGETELLNQSIIYDSDAESAGGSSSDSDIPIAPTTGAHPNIAIEGTTHPGNARRIFKFVDRIATSNFFQTAAELSFVQKAMENMSTNITLGIDLKGLVARVTVNIPPPPSDRLWLGFRGPPRLWFSARPTVGDKSVDWTIVTNVIEGKLREAVNKHLVYPNMVDFTVPLLGKNSTTEL